MELASSRSIRFLTTVSLSVLTLASYAHAGGIVGNNQAVGGVMIDAEGMVRAATVVEQQEVANLIRVALDAPQGDLAEAVQMRMISLKGLQQAVAENRQQGGPLPESISLLAGLQRIEFVFVDQENNDIVLGGPAEPWKLAEDGSIVGAVTGGATLRLDDLIVALRAVDNARNGGISCSIEPTAEGRHRLQQLLRRVNLRPGQNPAYLEPAMREAFGPQQIRLTGVPTDSRYARTMVAADFQMKRVAMALTNSPVAGLPSYLQLARNANHSAAENPRWWMACNYDALSRTKDGLAWKLSGQGVKTLTEQEIVKADGNVEGAGRAGKLAQKWADMMTAHYNQLAREMPIFGDLRNLMDLSVVATLIVQEDLADKAGLELSLLLEDNPTVEFASYATPKTVEPQSSFVRGRAGWIVTASGGVQVNAFEVVENQKTDASIADVRAAALASNENKRWWWNR